MTRVTRVALVLALFVAALALAPRANAGDRALELLLGDMTPSASRACMRDVARELRRREHQPLAVTRWGERTVRRAVGDDEGAWLAWTAQDLDPIRRWPRETPFDAIALVDCSDRASSARMLLLSPRGDVARLTMRETIIDEERARWLARTLLTHAQIGFSP